MLVLRRILLTISIVFCIPSSLLREEGQWAQTNRTFISKEIFFDGKSIVRFNATFSRCHLGEDPSVNAHSGEQIIPTIIHEYPLPVHVQTKYQTEREEYTFRESITFSLRTRQSLSQSVTILAGLVSEDIYYVFDIENNRLKILFVQNNLPDLILTTNKTHSKLINDGQWHRVRVDRLHRKVNMLALVATTSLYCFLSSPLVTTLLG